MRKDINLLNDKGKNVSDPTKIAELLNKYFASVGPKSILLLLVLILIRRSQNLLKKFKEYMKKIKVNKTFFLNATTPQEILEPSNSPWRSQLIVTSGERHKRPYGNRLFSNHKRIQLDDYPLP